MDAVSTTAATRAPRWLRVAGGLLVALAVALMTAWACGVIYYGALPHARVGAALALGFAAATGLAFALTPRRRRTLAGFVVAFAIVLGWWLAIPASNERDWQPEVSVTPWATVEGDRAHHGQLRFQGSRRSRSRSRRAGSGASSTPRSPGSSSSTSSCTWRPTSAT